MNRHYLLLFALLHWYGALSGQDIAPFAPISSDYMAIPTTNFFINLASDPAEIRPVDEVGRIFECVDRGCLIQFEQMSGTMYPSQIWDLMAIVDEKTEKTIHSQDFMHEGWTGSYQVRKAGGELGNLSVWSVELMSAMDTAVAVALCPDSLTSRFQNVIQNVFSTIRFSTQDTLGPFAGLAATLDLEKIGYEVSKPIMPGALTCVPIGQETTDFPEVMFTFSQSAGEMVDNIMARIDTMSSTDHRIITREEGYFKLIELERDQRVNADQIQLYVVTYCEGRSLFGMGIAPYSEEQLEEFKEIARAIKCQ